MSEEEFAVILHEFRQLRRALSEAVGQITHQEGEIKALQWLIEEKRLATPDELDAACEKGARLIHALLHESEDDAANTSASVQNELGKKRVLGALNEPRSRTNGGCRRRVTA
jgi:hypothetical protein